MKSNQPSDTYKLLYDYIIDDLLFQICSNTDYCVRYVSGPKQIPFVIWDKYEEYRNKALEKMHGTRLDRHKLASCICGAIIEVRPLTSITGKIRRNANEILALEVGINVIKFYMMCELLYKMDDEVTKFSTLRYLKEKFTMRFPSVVCDDHDYKTNLQNSLLWSHHNCDITKKECFHYDIWAYAKLFYHLELYNRDFLNSAYQEFINGGVAK